MIGVAWYLGANIRFEEQWVLYEALRTTASIIFAVVGVWLAIVYPERLKSPFSQTFSSPVYRRGFKQLFFPCYKFHFYFKYCVTCWFVGSFAQTY